MDRVILHVDMDSFFCSVETALDPRLRGRPVVVGGSPDSRGVVAACSYPARARGVRSGMPVARAFRLCPEAVFLPTRPSVYTQISLGVIRILTTFTDRVEPASIDESYMDLTGVSGGFSGAVRIAEKIRARIRERFRITASIGIGPTKAIAKIGSRRAKPDGVELIPPERARAILDPLPVSTLGGVGEKTARALRAVGIRTMGDLAAADGDRLQRMFGKNGDALRRLARGEELSPLVPFADSPDAKSMSHETTFSRDRAGKEELETTLLWLSERLARRLRRERLAGDVFRIKLRFPDFRTVLRSRTLPEATDDERTLFRLAREEMERHRKGKPVRLIGVGLGGLAPAAARAPELDLDRERRAYQGTLPVFDAVRDRYGEGMLRKARLL
ncbi:MAG: DNA polymerase IV [Candidatus Eisenbacteria bacterium]|nr:DNA polymerase IV [Candidatus Eisenbacteria bacterium]